MKVVLLFFCVIFGIIILNLILLILSTIKLNIEEIRISNFEKGTRKNKLETEFLIYLELYLFGKIKIAKVRLKRELFEKAKAELKKQNLQKDAQILKEMNIIELIKKLKIKVSKVNLETQLGTEELGITVFLVTIISSLVSILLRNTNYKKVKYNIMPLYQFGNVINFNLNCIISVKMVHIIYVIYILIKEGRRKNERTSNRRPYDYSYE